MSSDNDKITHVGSAAEVSSSDAADQDEQQVDKVIKEEWNTIREGNRKDNHIQRLVDSINDIIRNYTDSDEPVRHLACTLYIFLRRHPVPDHFSERSIKEVAGSVRDEWQSELSVIKPPKSNSQSELRKMKSMHQKLTLKAMAGLYIVDTFNVCRHPSPNFFSQLGIISRKYHLASVRRLGDMEKNVNAALDGHVLQAIPDYYRRRRLEKEKYEKYILDVIKNIKLGRQKKIPVYNIEDKVKSLSITNIDDFDLAISFLILLDDCTDGLDLSSKLEAGRDDLGNAKEIIISLFKEEYGKILNDAESLKDANETERTKDVNKTLIRVVGLGHLFDIQFKRIESKRVGKSSNKLDKLADECSQWIETLIGVELISYEAIEASLDMFEKIAVDVSSDLGDSEEFLNWVRKRVSDMIKRKKETFRGKNFRLAWWRGRRG